MFRGPLFLMTGLLGLMVLIANANAGTTKWCGGQGGTKTTTLTCPSGALVIGLGGYGGTYLEDIAILCGKPDANSNYLPSGDWKYGPKRILPEGTGDCDDGTAVTNVTLRSGVYVDRLTHGACSNCRLGKCFSALVDSFTVNAGGKGGSRCDLTCPADEGIYKLEIRSGFWIDAVRAHCRKP